MCIAEVLLWHRCVNGEKNKYAKKRPEEIPFWEALVPSGDKYYFYFVFAGFWRVAMAWLEEDEALSPEKMTEITMKIMREDKFDRKK